MIDRHRRGSFIMIEWRQANPRVLESWYEKSGVRGSPRRVVSTDDDILKDFFPRHLVTHLAHPAVAETDEVIKRYLLAQHLYQWLNFTKAFEVGVVCRATKLIAEQDCGIEVPSRVRMDAYKILVDESYHALYSVDAVEQIQTRSGIEALPYDFQPFLDNLDRIGADHPRHRRLVQLVQVFVFETLITGLLVDIPKDPNVVSLVRQIARDHAIDEGRHHVYFADFFGRLWGQLEPGDRQVVAALLPDLIIRSLQPATRSASSALREIGFSPAAARSIIAESYDQESVTAGIRSAAERTIGILEDYGVLDQPGAREGFAESGLLDF
ncbi:diiron oxygenase [Micromonospora orduensis]|uniref:Diiron oxygenase n=1 Tax=Micromonospora orduensis TaxID=1420891 RepID=A0A5C4QSC7_9ACTN|nr:diiron oxygenase [Micromonospora orduensis]TNH29644.1 diiron oxygenase [Micromonospora orduensis]